MGDDEEVAPDAVQLMTVATFNGICRLITALSRGGVLTRSQLDKIHDSMTHPLDDPDWRDDEFIAAARDMVDTVLAQAIKDAKEA